jgi:hypothetical protein
VACFVLFRTQPRSVATTTASRKPALSLIRQVLSYFVSRPTAVEGLEDVARWRLLSLEIARNVEETEDAIEWLVQQGVLERVETRAAAPLYRLCAAKRQDAAELLTRLTDEGS